MGTEKKKMIWALVGLLGTVWGDYTSKGDVVVLTQSNFNDKVINSDELWVVEFYAPWCGHCKALEPEYKKFAKEMKGTVNVGAVDMTQHQAVGAPYGIKGFPTIKIFGYNKKKPSDYRGARTADALGDEAFSQLRKLKKDQANGGKSSGGGSSGGSKKKAGGNKVVTLTDSNFRSKVIEGGAPWLVEFYAPWCGHCQRLEPEWKAASAEVHEKTGNKVKLGMLDATQEQATAQQYGIQGYPTIKMFFPDGRVEDYNGGRVASDIVSQAMIMFEEVAEPPELYQLLSKDTLDSACTDVQVCVLAFLPHILDDGAKERNNRLDLIKGLIDTYKRKQWGWIWSESYAHPKLDEQLGVSSYPTLVVVNPRKNVSLKMSTGFHKKGVEDFIRNVAYGKTAGAVIGSFDQFPDISAIEAWDGKDGQLPEEDEYDLDDFEWDDEPEDVKDEL